MTNVADAGTEAYYHRLVEHEAYFIGTRNGLALGINEPLSREKYEKLKQDNPDIQETESGVLYKVNEDGTVTRYGIKLPSALVLTGKETLETLLKVQKEIGKLLSNPEIISNPEIKDHKR